MKNTDIFRSQRGFALVSALFVLVILALLGAAMVLMSGGHSHTPAAAIEGARAYQSARSGLEWGIHQALNDPGGTCSPSAGATTNFSLDNFDIQVTCQSTTFQEGGPTDHTIYHIVSESRTGTFGEHDYASRRMEARITDAP